MTRNWSHLMMTIGGGNIVLGQPMQLRWEKEWET